MSKIAQPVQGGGVKADQRKIYIDWANNKLRKYGFTDSLVQDLQKDIPDGLKLPKVIHAVIQEEVPATLPTVSNDNERRQNIEACVAFLQRKGINCAGFTTKDVTEGSMRAILQLFFSLSQYRPRGSDSDHPPSRISRPTSPGLRQLHSVHSTNNSLAYPSSQPQPHSNSQPGSHVPTPQSLHPTNHTPLSFKPQGNHITAPNSLSPPLAVSHSSSSSSSSVASPGGGNNGTTHPSGSNLKSRPSQRRTAGSTIPTGMDMLGHRRVQYKNVSLLNDDTKQQQPGDEKKETPPPSGLVEPTKSGSSSPALRHQNMTGLSQPSSSSGLPQPHGVSSGLRPPESSGLRPPEGSGSTSRSSGIQSGLKAPTLSKLQSSTDKVSTETKSDTQTSTQEGKTVLPPEKELQPPSGSKLKMLGGAKAQRGNNTGGRNTPSFGPSKISKPTSNLQNPSEPGIVSSGSIGEKSGITRPMGRLQPPGDLKSAALKSGGEKEKSPGLKSPDSLLKPKGDETRSSIPGVAGGSSSSSSSTTIPGPSGNIPGPGSNISGPSSGIRSFGGKTGAGGYQKVKVGATAGGELRQPLNREAGRTFSLPHGPGGITRISPPRKIENSPEPERSSSVPKPTTTKLQPMSQLSRARPSGESALIRQSSEPAVNAAQNENNIAEISQNKQEQNKQESTETSAENEIKSVSKLAMFSRKHSSNTSLSSPSGSTETISKIVDPKTTEPEPAQPPEPSVNNNKSKLPPPPLDINNTPETTPSKTENRSSGSSIGSFTGSLNSQSESSIVDVQTPSPLGGRKYVRRTSPEGMSVDETASPRDLNKLSDLSHESKEEVFPLSGSGEDKEKENVLGDGGENIESSFSSKVKRAHSLSPKSSRRILPLQPSPGMVPNASVAMRNVVVTKPSGSLENVGKNGKPVRSSLKAPRQPGDSRTGKHVTISPHSSVESFSSSDNSLVHTPGLAEEKQEIVKRNSQTERPKSLEDLESHTFSLGGFPGDLHPHLLVRRGSTRSDKFDYSDEVSFLQLKLSEDQRGMNSTPELLETYENQLSTLKRDLESKAKMLNMYETSMADLSSKVHLLKRSLVEKDQEIKHLNEEKHKWNEYPFDQHSLAPSRLDTGALSDGGYSDGTPEFERDDSSSKKAKKKFLERFSIRQKRNKKDQDISPQMEVTSMMGGFLGGGGVGGSATGNSKSMKRGAKNQASDLMSISEYSTIEGKMPEFDSKSYIYDTRSEYGGYVPTIINEETGVTIYEEDGPGTEVTVNLLTDNALINNGRMDVVVLGSLKITPEISWVTMDTKICDIFKHHIDSIDLDGSLCISDESILNYHIGAVRRAIGNALLPFTTPHQALEDGSAEISITMRGTAQESCDALAYRLLINTSQLSSYIAMLIETQWIVVMGTKGTCKSTLAEGLASYLELLVREEQTEEDEIGLIGGEDEQPLVNRFSIASGIGASGDGLDIAKRFIKHELPHRMNRSSRTPILLFDNIYDCQTIEQLISAAGTLPKRPFIISTLCSGGTTRGVPLHQLMFRHNIRVVTCSPTEEPIYGILMRSLRKRLYRLKASDDVERESEVLVNWLPLLLDHLNYFINKFHSNNVALGPRVFMNCPLEATPADMEVWFINLWNHFVIPYLMGTIMAGIETYSADPNLLWIDVREWVVESYPWQHSHGANKLKTLNPEDVGWNHAVRPQQSRFMYMKDNDTQSVLGMKNIEMAI